MKLGESGEPGALPYLAAVLRTGSPADLRATGSAAANLLTHCELADLPRLDELVRSEWSGEHWSQPELDRVGTWKQLGESGRALTRLASMNANGRVRERAVRSLATIAGGTELRFLLLRLNDWVRQVEELALEAVIDRISEESAHEFAAILPLVAWLERTNRVDHASVLAQIHEALRSTEVRQTMLVAMSSLHRDVRRMSFRILIEVGATELPGVVRHVLGVEDSVLRLFAARSLRPAFDDEQLRIVLPAIVLDRAPPVRLQGLRLWWEIFPEDAEGAMESALLDQNGSLRAMAQYHLRERGPSFLRDTYLGVLTGEQPELLAPAMAGLAEVGEPADAQAIACFLESPLPSLRRAAVGAIVRLGGESYLARAFELVADSSAGVSRQATRAVRKHVAELGHNKLWSMYSEFTQVHVRHNLLLLIAQLSKWEAIPYLLTATACQEERLSGLACSLAENWERNYNRSQAQPSHEEAARLTKALVSSERGLPQHLAESIRFIVRSLA